MGSQITVWVKKTILFHLTYNIAYTFRINGISDQWDFGPMGFRTNGISDQWDFGPMGFRTNGISDQWDFGIMRCPQHNTCGNI